MSISTFSSYRSKAGIAYPALHQYKNSATVSSGYLHSSWLLSPNPGAAPSGSTACYSNLAGSFKQTNASTIQRIIQVATSLGSPGTLILADRLCHMGGFNGTNSVNLTSGNFIFPTAVLPRYTSGLGVMGGVEIYSYLSR